MIVKFKALKHGVELPQYAKPGDAGLDLIAHDDGVYVEDNKMNAAYTYWDYGTGLAVEIPDGYVGLIYPRSSISMTGMMLSNSVGVIDSGYRGEIRFRFRKTYGVTYKKGDKIGQLVIVPYPLITPVMTDQLSETVRGTDGYGSTGK